MLNKSGGKNVRFCLLAIMAMVTGAVAVTAMSKPAHALLVLGNYVFVGPKEGAATYKIKNISPKPEGYNIEWTQLIQQPTGAKKPAEPGVVYPGVMDAEPYMYVAPRRLMLRQGQLQHIRFMVRRMENMQPGEYRSYIYLNPEKIPEAYTGQQGSQSGRQTASASMTMLTGFRIPVIFLHGDTTLQTSISNARIEYDNSGRQVLRFTFNRQGTRSAIGDLTAMCGTPQGELQVVKAEIKVYTEVNQKEFSFKPGLPDAGCSYIGIDFLVHEKDPDFTGAPQRLATLTMQ